MLTHVWGILTHVWEMITLSSPLMPSTPLVYVSSCMRVNLSHTCVRSHASHTSYTCHHQRFLTHVWAYFPLWLVKTLIHVESTWPPPHRSWEILALHLAFNLNHLLHPFSYKRRALFLFFNKHYLPHCYSAGFVRNHIP